ncbi:hypothetical protein ALI44B_01740 [Leifsonia sp. ALI-44-B]|uniref:hypothetical protein n=1 Tax=Leifsonia sp. ALI-44-B TaxID=1933776 RepID=UPI00097CB93F|nr:hypothetical protein [Leifsonia sp. ALI-44-B]ONI63461.1 hypothetical protein ALI44B_01740 [Leifsonia sp. ALI-44-B]
MAPGARIVFTSFAARTDPMLAAWSRFQAELDGVDARGRRSGDTPEPFGTTSARVMAEPDVRAPIDARAHADTRTQLDARSQTDARTKAARGLAEPAVVWRLLAPNNRELARSAHLYRTIVDAERHAVQLQNSSEDLEVSLVLGPRPGMRGWVASHRGVVVLTCGRWYGGAAANSESAAAAVQLVASAAIARSPGSAAATLVGSA